MRLAKILVILNVAALMGLVYVFEYSRVTGRPPSGGGFFDFLAAGVSGWCLFGAPLVALVGLVTWPGTRYRPALIVHPLVILLCLGALFVHS